MKVFTKDILKSVNTMALVRGYNRAVQEEFLDTLPDQLYVPFIELLHEHKAGQPCELHVRCVFQHDGSHFAIDVEMGCYDLLMTTDEVLKKHEELAGESAPV